MAGLTEEQEEKLAQINAGEGKNLTPAQKAVAIKFGTIEIKAGEKQFGEVDIPAGPKVAPKTRDAVKPIEQE